MSVASVPFLSFLGPGQLGPELPDINDGQQRADAALNDVFDLVISLDGTLSGEHGIGLAKRDFLSRAIDANALALMHRIKAQFDPDGILNPGKLLPAVAG